MNGNYEWQKFAANKRIEGYRRQAEVQRQANQNAYAKKEESTALGKVGFALALGIALLVIGFMLTSCQMAAVPQAAAEPEGSNEMSMADRIRFHDQLWASKEAADTTLASSKPETGMSTAERIRFQDERDQLLASSEMIHAGLSSANARKGLSMADRIRFQDERDQLRVSHEANPAAHTGATSGKDMCCCGQPRAGL